MKRAKPLPIPQKEFFFTPDTFNLIQEFTGDGERISRDHEEAEKARHSAQQAQSTLLRIEQ